MIQTESSFLSNSKKCFSDPCLVLHQALVQERNQSLEFQPKNSTEKSACSLPLETETQIPLINPVNNEQQRKSGEDETTLFHQSSNEIQSVTTNKSNNDKNEIKQGDGNTLLQSKDCQQNQEEENVENEIPLSAILTSTDQKCVVCNQNLSTLSYLVFSLRSFRAFTFL